MKKLILALFTISSLLTIQSAYAHDKEPPCNHETLGDARDQEGSHRDHFEASDNHEHDHHHHEHDHRN